MDLFLPRDSPGQVGVPCTVVNLRGLTPAYEGSIAQQIDECRKS